MNKQDSIALFNSIYPDFFSGEDIRSLPEDCVFEEMVLPLKEFDPSIYDKQLGDDVSFGLFHGDFQKLLLAIKKVVPEWVDFFSKEDRVYCGYINGEIASFCMVEDMGTHTITGRTLKVGGPGCVGTIPEYRNRGLGLIMVRNATQLLKDEGFDYSYIHYTGVGPWYGKLGYKTSVIWDKHGVK